MTEALVIGGGPAGAAAAIHLAQAKAAPVLLERTTAPTDKVCGDFLSIEAALELARLGIDLDQLGASRITRVRIIHGRRIAATDLPFTARGLSRRIMDEALLARAVEAGACVRRGTAVQSLHHAGERFVCRSPSGEETARSVFLATGKHDLRGLGRPPSQSLGLKTYVTLTPEQRADLQGHVELVLFQGGYLGLQPVEDDRVVLCAMIEKRSFAARGGSWLALLDSLGEICPHVRHRLSGAKPCRERPVAVAGVPYGYVHRSQHPLDPFRLGDQACVIPSLTGDGIALALHGARSATRAWLSGTGPQRYHDAFATHVSAQMRTAGLLHRLLLGPGAGWAAAAGAIAPGLLREAVRRTRLRAS